MLLHEEWATVLPLWMFLASNYDETAYVIFFTFRRVDGWGISLVHLITAHNYSLLQGAVMLSFQVVVVLYRGNANFLCVRDRVQPPLGHGGLGFD